MYPTYIETSKWQDKQFLYCDLWLIEQNIAGNYSRVGYSLKIGSGNPRYSTARIDCSLNGSVYSNNGTPVFTWENSTNGKVIQSGEITVYHESDGNKSFYWGMSAGMQNYAKNVWGEGYITLNQIPRQANLTGANDFNDEQNGYMTYNNAAGNAVDQLVGGLYWNGNEALAGYRDVGKTAGNYTFSLSEAERNAIRSRMANTNGPTNIIYYLRTLIGGNYYYSTITKNIYITNANPTMGDFKFQDVNAVTKALTGSDDIIIKGKSNVRIYEITANAFKYATKKNIIVDGVSAIWSDTYEKTINAYSKNTIGVAMSDSRGNTTSTMTKTIEAAKFKEYFDITKTEQSATRGDNGVGEATTFVCKGTWFNASFGAQVNTLAATYRYKKSGTTSWTTGTTAITVSKTGNNFTINQILKGDTAGGFNIENVYDVEIILTDKLSSATFIMTVIAGSPAIAILENKISLGGQYNESLPYKVQLWGEGPTGVSLNGKELKSSGYDIGDVYITNSNTDPAVRFGGTWVRVSGRFLLGAGGGYTNGATGGEANVTLTQAQMPAHVHWFNRDTNWLGDHQHGIAGSTGGPDWTSPYAALSGSTGQDTGVNSSYRWSPLSRSAGGHAHNVSGDTDSRGSGQSHNNMPPYRVFNIWYRSA